MIKNILLCFPKALSNYHPPEAPINPDHLFSRQTTSPPVPNCRASARPSQLPCSIHPLRPTAPRNSEPELLSRTHASARQCAHLRARTRESSRGVSNLGPETTLDEGPPDDVCSLSPPGFSFGWPRRGGRGARCDRIDQRAGGRGPAGCAGWWPRSPAPVAHHHGSHKRPRSAIRTLAGCRI